MFYENKNKNIIDIKVPYNEEINKNNEKKNYNTNKRIYHFDMKNFKKKISINSHPSSISTDFYQKINTYTHNLEPNHRQILNNQEENKKNDILDRVIDNKITEEDEIINSKNQERNKGKMFSKTQIIELEKETNIENVKNLNKSNFYIDYDSDLLMILKQHFLFENLNENEIKKIINSSIKHEYNSGKIIFNKGDEANSFYIIKKGIIRIFDNQNSQLISKEYSSFGEIGLINSLNKRNYSAISESKSILMEINKNSYISIIENKKHTELNKDNIFNYFLETYLIFKGITKEEKNNFKNLIKYKEIKSIHKKISLKEHFSNCFFPFNNKIKIFFIGKGKIQVSIKQNNNNFLSKIISEGYNIGIRSLLFNDEIETNNDKKKKNIIDYDFFIGYSETSEILYLNEKMFIECFGLNYKNYLLNSCALFFIKNDFVFNAIKYNCNIPDEEIYKLFKIKKYRQNTLIFQKGISQTNNKSIILLEGNLTGFKTKSLNEKNKYLFEGNNLLIYKDFEEDFITSIDSIIYETNIEQFQNYLIQKKLNSKYLIILYNILNKFQIFYDIDIKKVFEIVKHVQLKFYKQNHVIQKIGKEFKNIYLIENGTIGVFSKEKKLKQIIDTGNSFGGLSILLEQNSLYNYIVYSKEVILYQINKNYYMDLLKDQSINNYFKYKIYLGSDISLNDLYYLSYLGRGRFGNVCLVHNEIFFYAIKAISKSFAEKQKSEIKYLFFEKNTLTSIDHPFILKLIKTLKNENWLFFLMEYISGINMGEYLETRKNINNVFETKFYAALLLITINYLHKKKIIHRDIKPTNIMIDNKGYIKLIDFGTAKILKDNEKTKTVIGSPNFISPEVLLGKGYSFSCDYWSIGICIYYIYYGILPFGNNSVEIFDTYKEIIEKKLSFPNNNNFELNSLLNTLLDKNENNRNNLFKMLKTHFFFKDIDFHALLNYKIKPPFIPNKDQRINEDNLQNKNSPFTNFMENQKTDTKNTVTLNGTKDLKKNVIVNINENIINNKWYEDF